MKTKLKKFFFAALVMCELPLSFAFAEAAEPTEYVNISFPKFKITVSMEEFEPDDNAEQKWPFIVYNDITYVPMTYHKSAIFGLNIDWDDSTGLSVEKRDISELGYYYRGLANPSETEQNFPETAAVAPFDITVNGQKIDNQNEEYPLLLYKDITYFPLTWRFAVDEFGWGYSFDPENGLDITSVCRYTGGNGLFYFYDGVKIFIRTASYSTVAIDLGGPRSGNLFVTVNGETKEIGGYYDNFGFELEIGRWNEGDVIDYKDGWVYTTWGSCWKNIPSQYCKVNIETEEIVIISPEEWESVNSDLQKRRG